MKVPIIVLGFLMMAKAGPATEMAAYKGQFCTDPRTMRKHAAYTEWADAYSCTRHRCQPGGRNLAIYTVGCKRVEAPESAIECEEVVEDTNMQFPYCCTRLRCLVVVRGEVWTRVLGQPWETLPAAPWSHMYKMKKPPPGADQSFMPKVEEGPVYELQSPDSNDDTPIEDKILRSNKKVTEGPECNDLVARAAPAPAPDIVIALSTGTEKYLTRKSDESPRHKRRGIQNKINMFDADSESRAEEPYETTTEKEKQPDPAASEERYYANSYGVTQKAIQPHQQESWTEVPQTQWNEHDPLMDNDPAPDAQQRNVWNEREREHEPASDALRMPPREPAMASNVQSAQTWEHQTPPQPEFPSQPEVRRNDDQKVEKANNLQALVDAIGTRMRDIESVVAKMTEKVVHEGKSDPAYETEDDRQQRMRTSDNDQKYHEGQPMEGGKRKKPQPENDHYKRFSDRSRGSKYIRGGTDSTTEQPLFVEDTNLNGYFSDASNSLVNRRPPKEPAMTYMAPITDTRRRGTHEDSEEQDKKRKKKMHKKKHSKGHHKKHHAKEDKRRKFRMNSVERGALVSLEDSSAVTTNNNANNGTFDNSID